MMSPADLLVVVLFALACLLPAPSLQAETERHTARIDNMGEPATLTCTEQTNLTFLHWVLPDLTLLDSTYQSSKLKSRALEWSPGNYTLYIPQVEEEDLGDYLCSLRSNDSGKLLYTSTRLYLYRPDLWEVYRMNTIIGCSAAVIVLALLMLFWLINSCRHKRKHRSDERDAETEMPPGYSNAAASYDTKMGEVNRDSHVSQSTASTARPSVNYSDTEVEVNPDPADTRM